MKTITIGIVDEDPSRDVMYRLDRINEEAQGIKLISGPAKFEIVKKDTVEGRDGKIFNFRRTVILIHCHDKDETFWLGVYFGKDLGINIAKQMYSIS